MKSKNILIIGVIIVVAMFGILFLSNSGKQNTDTGTKFGSSSQKLIPVDSITHGHGLAVDVENSNNVYIATHHGLFLLKNDKDLYQVGDSDDDYMGFSPNAKNAKVFFTSGHPKTGGNIGLEESEDGGFTWKHVSDGPGGPVDFHAMSVSPANPNLIYGWFQGKLYRTSDRGTTWETFPTEIVFTSLVSDPKDENIVYATTPQGQGVVVSKNKGQNWEVLSDELKGGIVSSLAINLQDNQKMLTFSEKLGGLGKTTDGGKTWQKITADFDGGKVLFIAFAKQNPNIVYALTHLNTIYKSTDEANTWSKIR